MAWSKYSTKQQTMSGATATATVESSDSSNTIRGKLKAIAIETSASNAFAISGKLGEVSQDLFGSSGSPVTVASDTVKYPRAKIVEADDTDGAAGDNLWTEFILNGAVTVSVSSGNANDTFNVTLYVEE